MTVQPTRILQIVPRLTPDVDGVGDYALQLANQLLDRHSILSDFLVFRPNPKLQSHIGSFPVHRLETHTVQGLLNQVPKNISTIFLQYLSVGQTRCADVVGGCPKGPQTERDTNCGDVS